MKKEITSCTNCLFADTTPQEKFCNHPSWTKEQKKSWDNMICWQPNAHTGERFLYLAAPEICPLEKEELTITYFRKSK